MILEMAFHGLSGWSCLGCLLPESPAYVFHGEHLSPSCIGLQNHIPNNLHLQHLRQKYRDARHKRISILHQNRLRLLASVSHTALSNSSVEEGQHVQHVRLQYRNSRFQRLSMLCQTRPQLLASNSVLGYPASGAGVPVSITLIFGLHGCTYSFVPSSSILIRPNTIFVQSIK
ncbi:uncharacterized protein LOC119990199 [Tripterygium wilfordii]|uniref:uncharacterized protein LOC119990199 n=1 Tax=Tripterygium wilfordii TaxID=458696 RepID=UPI0018F85997|nr:uncharacterized protein LOC119990199 [Tripterygium wilfordii]